MNGNFVAVKVGRAALIRARNESRRNLTARPLGSRESFFHSQNHGVK
jgi:hypothetical protein